MPRAKIEQRHTYQFSQHILSGMFHDESNISNGNVNPDICYAISPTYPIQGVEDNQRIGRKITSTSLVVEGYISLFNYAPPATENPSAYEIFNTMVVEQQATYPLDSPVSNPFKIGIRQFVVEVDTEFVQGLTSVPLKRKFLSWFHDLLIYTDTTTQVSNSGIVKRESTSYTGQFKILLDKHYILSQKSPQVHFQHTISYKRDLSFDGTGSPLPTNKVVYLLTFGPTNVYKDYYNFGFSQYMVTNKNEIGPISQIFQVAHCSSNLKLNYLDV